MNGQERLYDCSMFFTSLSMLILGAQSLQKFQCEDMEQDVKKQAWLSFIITRHTCYMCCEPRVQKELSRIRLASNRVAGLRRECNWISLVMARLMRLMLASRGLLSPNFWKTCKYIYNPQVSENAPFEKKTKADT